MGFNKRPLVLGFNDNTLIPSGLVEVILNLSDSGDVCDTKPSNNQVLAWNGAEWCGSSIQFTGGGGGGSFTCADLNSCDLSALSNVCSDEATPGQALAFNGSQYCPSSLNFIHNGAGNVTVNPKLVMTQVPTIGGSDVISESTGDTRYATAAQGATADDAIPNQSGSPGDILVIPEGGSNFSGKIGSGTLFDEGLAANNLNTIGDVGYTSVENGMTLVRAGGQWKALSPPQFFNVKGQGGVDSGGDSLGSAAAIDHGLALSGLGDDDHPQYVLSAGTRAMTALTVNNNISTSGIIARNIVPNSEDGLNIRAVNISATTSVSSPSITGVNILGTSITGTNVTATTQVSAPTVRGGTSVLGTLGSFTNVGATNVTGTNILANTLAPFADELTTTLSVSADNLDVDNLDVLRTGQMNPTVYIQEADWLTPGGAANGFGTTQSGSNAGFGQCFDNDIMHPDKGTIGVYEVRSGTDAYGRAFLTTFNNALAVSSCAISFTSRIAPSGLWVDGSNEGKMCFGFRNGTGNSAATYAMEFQYGQGGGATTTTWSAVVTDNSNSTVSDTGIVVSAQEFQVLQVSCNENWQNVNFYVDGVLKAQFNINDHHIPDSRYNRLGLAWAINNANIYSTANTTVGNEIFVDWHQIRMTHNNTTRGKDLIQ